MSALKRQRVVDILLQIMVDSIGFTPTQIGILFTFLARQMATPDNTIIVNRSLFEQVLESLCSRDEEGEERHEERQQALIELIKAGGLQHFSEDKLIELVEKAKFFKICERLYWKRRQYEKIMSCYLRDSVREGVVFHFVEHVLQGEKLSETEKEKVRNEVISSIHTLIAISSTNTAQLVLSCFCDRLRIIVNKLQSEPELLYKLLQAIFECREEEGGHHLSTLTSSQMFMNST
ncbi:hypothetical protein LSAT2_018721 [Lamellibrachia satsuma]|nr:hypothetical protein LSAT2_018721 [Lamellibrachia satsuma]